MVYTIYDRVYKKLLELDVEEISVKEFGILVSNMRINKEEIMIHIRQKLLELGLTVDAVDRICSNLSFKLRWTKADIRDVANHLRQRGLIQRKSFSVLSVNRDVLEKNDLVKVMP